MTTSMISSALDIEHAYTVNLINHADPAKTKPGNRVVKTFPCSWAEIVEMLSNPLAKTKAETPLVIGVEFEDDTRHNDGAKRNTWYVDIDGKKGPLTVDQALERCRRLGLTAVAHTTASHTADAPRTRVFGPLSRSVDDVEWERVKAWIRAEWPEHDPQALDLSRVTFAPVKIDGYQCKDVGGRALDVDSLPEEPAKEIAPAVEVSEVVSAEHIARVRAAVLSGWPARGSRHSTRLALAGCLVAAGWPDAAIVDVMPVPGGDDERASCVATTRRATTRTGWPTLARLVGEDSCKAISEAVAGPNPIAEYMKARDAMKKLEQSLEGVSETAKLTRPSDKLKPISLSALRHDLTTHEKWKHSHTTTGKSAPAIVFDKFAGEILLRESAPIKAHARIDRDARWSDGDTLRVKEWCEVNLQVQPSKETVEGAIRLVGEDNEINTVADWLDALGSSRIGAIEDLAVSLGLQTDIERKMLRKWLIAACARAYDPGVFVKSALVLYGPQDAGKSSTLRAMFGGRYHTTINGDLSDRKRVGEILSGKWCIEIEEAAAHSRTEKEAMKSCISDTHDDYRAAYDRHARKRARSCVFAVTTNRDDILKDDTGEVRYWCVTVGDKIDLDCVAALAGSAWAEARDAYNAKEQWWFADAEDKQQAANQADAMRDRDPLEEPLAKFLAGKAFVSLQEVIEWADIKQKSLVEAGSGRLDHRLGSCLRRLDCTVNSRTRKWTVPERYSESVRVEDASSSRVALAERLSSTHERYTQPSENKAKK